MALGQRLYRPACFLKLYVRFEDFSSSVDGDADPDDRAFIDYVVAAQKNVAKAAAALSRARAAADPSVAEKSRTAMAADRALAARKAVNPTSSPQSQRPGDVFSVTMVTAPLEAHVELNSVYLADKLSATFPFRDAPLVSQLIRASLVECYMGTIPAEQFGQPDRWRLPLERGQIMFRGYIDDWDTLHNAENATVTISARSLEAILIDGKINPWAKDYRIQGDGEAISTYVNRILGLFPPTAGKTGGDRLQAIYYPGPIAGMTPAAARAIANEPILDRKRLNRTLQSAQSRNQAAGGTAGAPAAPSALPPAGGTGPGETPGTGNPAVPMQAPTQEMTVWELITRACRLAGVIPTYDPSLLLPRDRGGPGDMLLLRPPHTAYAQVGGGVKLAGGSDELPPFGRQFMSQTGNTVASEVRLMVWGQNIKDFKTNRKLGRVRAPAVEVISLNTQAPPGERVLSIRYPPVGDKRASALGHKGQWALDRVQTMNVGAVRDIEQLAQIALGLYHDLARQELGVRIETDDMSSWWDPRLPIDPNEEPDLLRLRSGTPVRVLVATANKDPDKGAVVITELSTIFEKSQQNLRKWLAEQEGRFASAAEDEIAAVEEMWTRMATAYQTSRMTDVFYCRGINHNFLAEGGWSADMELINYLVTRSDPQNLSAEAQAEDAKLRISTATVTPPDQVDADARLRAAAALKGGLP